MGVGRRSELPGDLCVDGLPRGTGLHSLWHDALGLSPLRKAIESLGQGRKRAHSSSSRQVHPGLLACMFQFFFKYPSPVFTKGRFVLLGAWPAWLLPVLIFAGAGGLGVLIGWRMRNAAPAL